MITIPVHLQFVFESLQTDPELARKDAHHYMLQFLEYCPLPQAYGLKFKSATVVESVTTLSPEAAACEKIATELL